MKKTVSVTPPLHTPKTLFSSWALNRLCESVGPGEATLLPPVRKACGLPLEFLHFRRRRPGGQVRLRRSDLRKGSPFRKAAVQVLYLPPRLRLGASAAMATINKDTPCLFITTVTRNRLPVFRIDTPERRGLRVTGRARRSAGFALFAYVIMPEHLHVLADGILQASETLRLAQAAVAQGRQGAALLPTNQGGVRVRKGGSLSANRSGRAAPASTNRPDRM